MQEFNIQYITKRRITWLLSLGVSIFAILNSGNNENLFTALQSAVQTELLASDIQDGKEDIWQIDLLPTQKNAVKELRCFVNIDVQNRLACTSFKTTTGKYLTFCDYLMEHSGYLHQMRLSSKDHFASSTLS